MAYLLICDLNGRGDKRRKMNRYLRKNARMVQHSVWRFRDYEALRAVAERILEEGGRVLAFVESDRIPFELVEVRRFLRGVLNRTVEKIGRTKCPK
jgi:CRISPR/Cas system-associated endoribonuclease Cas2